MRAPILTLAGACAALSAACAVEVLPPPRVTVQSGTAPPSSAAEPAAAPTVPGERAANTVPPLPATGPGAPAAEGAVTVAGAEAPGAARIAVLATTRLDRMAQVVGILDVHGPSGDEAAALAELRSRAAALGADAVVGVEFHHAHGRGPTHLSGVAVRFLDRVPRTDR